MARDPKVDALLAEGRTMHPTVPPKGKPVSCNPSNHGPPPVKMVPHHTTQCHSPSAHRAPQAFTQHLPSATQACPGMGKHGWQSWKLMSHIFIIPYFQRLPIHSNQQIILSHSSIFAPKPTIIKNSFSALA